MQARFFRSPSPPLPGSSRGLPKLHVRAVVRLGIDLLKFPKDKSLEETPCFASHFLPSAMTRPLAFVAGTVKLRPTFPACKKTASLCRVYWSMVWFAGLSAASCETKSQRDRNCPQRGLLGSHSRLSKSRNYLLLPILFIFHRGNRQVWLAAASGEHADA